MSRRPHLLRRVAPALLPLVILATLATAAAAANFTITVSSNAGGTVTPGTTTVAAGADQSFAIQSYNCYAVSEVRVDGVSLGPLTTYTFANVHASHTLAVTFGASPATTTSLDATPASGSCARNTVLHAHVTNAIGGVVRWYEGAMLLGDAFVDGAGDASLTVYPFATGTHVLVAKYDGGLCGRTSQSAPLSYSVTTQTATIALSPSTATIGGFNPVTLTAAVADGDGTLTGVNGALDFYSDGTYLGSATLLFGVATLTTGIGLPGDHAVTARYAGNPCLGTATSAPVTVHVVQAAGSLALTSSATPSEWASPVTFTASVRADGLAAPWATGTVTFTIDGAPSSPVALVNGVAEYATSALAIGAHTVRADYSGSATVSASDATIGHDVVKATSHLTLTSPANPIGGQDVTFTASVTPAAATGTVTFSDLQNTFATVPVTNGQASAPYHAASLGSYAIFAAYSGDANATPATASRLQQFAGYPTSVSLGFSGAQPPGNPQPIGSTATLTATVSPPGATGNVEFTASNDFIAAVPLVNGQASTTYVIPSASSITFVAKYVGNGTYGPSSTSLTIQVVARVATALALTSSRNPELVSQPIDYTATISPPGVPGVLTFRQGAGVIGIIPITSGHATLATTTPADPGQYPISASYDGDDTYAPSTRSITQSVVTIMPVTLSITTPANPSTVLTIPVTVTVLPSDATGSVVLADDLGWSDTQPLVSAVASFTYTAPGYGTRLLTATYSGDAMHAPGTQQRQQAFSQSNAQPTTTTLTQDRPISGTGEWVQFVAQMNVSVAGTAEFTVDGAPAATVGMFGGRAMWETLLLPAGMHVVRVRCTPSGPWLPSESAVTHWVQDYLSDVLRVEWPNQHELLQIGSIVQLRWNASSAGPVPHVSLYLSRVDLPPVWEPIADGVPNTGTYDWTVTGPYTDEMRFAVIDLGGTVGSDASDLASMITSTATPALVTRLDAVAVDDGVRVRWALADAADVAGVDVERALAADGPWEAIEPERSSGNGETSAIDHTVEAGRTYWYRLVATTGAGARLVFGPVSAVPGAPVEFALGLPSPNPARNGFKLAFAVAHKAPVRLALLDVQGRTVDVLADGVFEPGRYSAAWNGRGRSGPLAAGLYFLQYRTPAKTFTSRVAIVK